MRKPTPSRRSSASRRSRHRRRRSRPSGQVASILPRRRVARLARTTGFIQRKRKVGALAFLVALVFGYAVETLRSMDAYRRFYTTLTKITLARSAFQKKFSKRSAAFFRAVFREAVIHHAARLGTRLGSKLAGFRDVCAIDATVVRLHDLLQKAFPATRTNHTKAAAKVHAVLSLSKRAVADLAISAERVSDREFLKSSLDWVAGRLLLFDLGYYSHSLFCAIANRDGFFLSRLKDSANPTIVAVRRGVARGQKIVGKRLWDINFAVGRPVDLDVQLDPRDDRTFRLVGVYNTERSCWHLYLTNLPVAGFSPEELAVMYRLRWEIELLFKELKSTHRLEDIRSRREEVVRTLLYATLLSLLATRVLARLVEEQDARDARRLSLRILSSYLIQHAATLAAAMLRGTRSLATVVVEVIEDISRTCRDPNPQRPSVLARLSP